MKIIIALDSFKGSLKAAQACDLVASAIKTKCTSSQIVSKPMADGGEGTAQAMIAARNGKWIARRVTGPLPDMRIDAGFAWFDNEKEALVEMASASGIEMLDKQQLNPLKTTTFGTGQLILAAADYGAKKILLAVGGSATVDCGLGAAMALGWKFLDARNNQIAFGGGDLNRVVKIVKPEDLTLPPIEVLCDVNNPLCGEKGAAKIFGPQKGATPQMVEILDKGLANIAGLVHNVDLKNMPGAGAAGGLSAGAVAFMNAKLVSGVDTIIKEIGLEKTMTRADWVITGEGSFDTQSLNGKVVSGIINIAKKTNTKIAVIAGSVSLTEKQYKSAGISAAFACRKSGMTLEHAIANCTQLLNSAAMEFADSL